MHERIVVDDESQLLAPALEPLRELEEQPDSGAVEVGRLRQVEDQALDLVRHRVDEQRADLVDVRQVDLARDVRDERRTVLVHA